jgi:hypothetical protein
MGRTGRFDCFESKKSKRQILMKKIIKKAAKYESKKSLNGPMKFLKGNVKTPVKKK